MPDESPAPLPLWPFGSVPGALGDDPIADVPAITRYAPEDAPNTGAAVIVLPGGAYGGLAPYEGEPIARWLNTLGVTTFVARYRLGPRYQHPAMWHDAMRAVRTVRARAAEWNIDPARIGVLGFSAGGHLASTISNHFDAGTPDAADPIERASSRPDFAVLIYPVITLIGDTAHAGTRTNLLGTSPDPALLELLSNHKQVTAHTPPTFLVHSTDDGPVPISHSLHYALALEAAGVPFAMQVYDRGGHGYGLGNRPGDDPMLATWPAQCALWMSARGLLGY